MNEVSISSNAFVYVLLNLSLVYCPVISVYPAVHFSLCTARDSRLRFALVSEFNREVRPYNHKSRIRLKRPNPTPLTCAWASSKPVLHPLILDLPNPSSSSTLTLVTVPYTPHSLLLNTDYMALTFPLTNLRSICFHRQNPRSSLNVKHILFSYNESSKPSFRISADLAPKARFVARRRESVSVKQLERPLGNV